MHASAPTPAGPSFSCSTLTQAVGSFPCKSSELAGSRLERHCCRWSHWPSSCRSSLTNDGPKTESKLRAAGAPPTHSSGAPCTCAAAQSSRTYDGGAVSNHAMIGAAMLECLANELKWLALRLTSTRAPSASCCSVSTASQRASLEPPVSVAAIGHGCTSLRAVRNAGTLSRSRASTSSTVASARTRVVTVAAEPASAALDFPGTCRTTDCRDMPVGESSGHGLRFRSCRQSRSASATAVA